jgi:hypothetical protein
MDKNVEEFQYLLQKEKWDEVSASNEPNTSFDIFMDTFHYYFDSVSCKSHICKRVYWKQVDN